jgi:hypothetical protein
MIHQELHCEGLQNLMGRGFFCFSGYQKLKRGYFLAPLQEKKKHMAGIVQKSEVTLIAMRCLAW